MEELIYSGMPFLLLVRTKIQLDDQRKAKGGGRGGICNRKEAETALCMIDIPVERKLA